MPLLTYRSREHDSTISLTRPDFENARAGRDRPAADDVDAVFDLGSVARVDFVQGVDVEDVVCHDLVFAGRIFWLILEAIRVEG